MFGGCFERKDRIEGFVTDDIVSLMIAITIITVMWSEAIYT